MELTKEQIQEIDNRLKKDGIKYWDLRIELLDHVVSDVESRIEKGEEFEKSVTNSFIALGWNGNLKHLNKKGWQGVNLKYRSMYFKGFIEFFKKPLSLLTFVFCFISFYVLSENVSRKVFVIISTVIFVLPVLLYIAETFKTYKMKLGKSIHKDYGLHYMMSSFMIFSVFFQFMKEDNSFFSISNEYHNLILLFLVPLHLVLCYSGYKVYKNAITRVENMRKQLLS